VATRAQEHGLDLDEVLAELQSAAEASQS